ncbi:MAG TPA: ribose 5-phosphate isomerase B [Abditibacteriaceae bacterium]|jgi:ribose 5-phosphate isomerase B
MKIAIGSDHAGFEMKGLLATWLREMGHEPLDCGTFSADSVDYTEFAQAVGDAINTQKTELGILICGTGQGSAMAANKIRGIRAALCNDPYSSRLTREHNNANVLVMGSRVIGPGLAREVVEAFLGTPFSQAERHQRRIDKLMLLEQTM